MNSKPTALPVSSPGRKIAISEGFLWSRAYQGPDAAAPTPSHCHENDRGAPWASVLYRTAGEREPGLSLVPKAGAALTCDARPVGGCVWARFEGSAMLGHTQCQSSALTGLSFLICRLARQLCPGLQGRVKLRCAGVLPTATLLSHTAGPQSWCYECSRVQMGKLRHRQGCDNSG